MPKPYEPIRAPAPDRQKGQLYWPEILSLGGTATYLKRTSWIKPDTPTDQLWDTRVISGILAVSEPVSVSYLSFADDVVLRAGSAPEVLTSLRFALRRDPPEDSALLLGAVTGTSAQLSVGLGPERFHWLWNELLQRDGSRLRLRIDVAAYATNRDNTIYLRSMEIDADVEMEISDVIMGTDSADEEDVWRLLPPRR